jgi:hydrogenase maturation protease
MLIIGCGNLQRGDDAAGILVAGRLRKLGIYTETCVGEATDFMDLWTGVEDVIVVDAVITGASVGSIRECNGRTAPISFNARSSTHGFGLAEAIELARALDRLPARLRIYGIEGQRFEHGAEISPGLHSGIEQVVRKIIDAVREASTVDGQS